MESQGQRDNGTRRAVSCLIGLGVVRMEGCRACQDLPPHPAPLSSSRFCIRVRFSLGWQLQPAPSPRHVPPPWHPPPSLPANPSSFLPSRLRSTRLLVTAAAPPVDLFKNIITQFDAAKDPELASRPDVVVRPFVESHGQGFGQWSAAEARFSRLLRRLLRRFGTYLPGLALCFLVGFADWLDRL